MPAVASRSYNPNLGILLREELKAAEETHFVWTEVELKGEVENTSSKLEVTSTLTGEVKLRGQIKVKESKSVEKEVEFAVLPAGLRPAVEQKIVVVTNGAVIGRLFIPTSGKMSLSVKNEEKKETSFDNVGFPLT